MNVKTDKRRRRVVRGPKKKRVLRSPESLQKEKDSEDIRKIREGLHEKYKNEIKAFQEKKADEKQRGRELGGFTSLSRHLARKLYVIVYKDGREILTDGLIEWCRARGLSYSTVNSQANKSKVYWSPTGFFCTKLTQK